MVFLPCPANKLLDRLCSHLKILKFQADGIVRGHLDAWSDYEMMGYDSFAMPYTFPNLTTYLAAWVVIGAAMAASLYDPAFATLGRIFGASARRPITVLTFIGGLASTASWPATRLLRSS